ncbi:hypothetical protein GCM10028784_39490 [Myceligenerans cantabricum]
MPRLAALTRATTRIVAAALAALVLALWCAPDAFAHTKLDSSEPAAGSTSDSPVQEVALRFTLPVTPLGDGIVIDGPGGAVAAEVVAAENGLVLVATPSDALTDGDYTVSWTAAAQDGHPLEGIFGFTVASAAPGPTEPSEDADALSGGDSSAGTGTTTGPSDTDDDAGSGSHADMLDMDHDTTSANETAAAVVEVVARLGRAAALWGWLVAAGGLAFVGLVLRGRDQDDVPEVLRVVRWTGALILAGLVVQVVAGSVLVAQGDIAAAASPSAIGDSLPGPTRWALGFQAGGAAAITAGAWRTLWGSWLAILGSMMAGIGHLLDGHSNNVEPRWLVVTADLTHLAAAATWVGGVVVMAILLRSRRRNGRRLDAALMGARFSVVGAVSIALVGAAGMLLAGSIIDRPAQLWESSWGLFLLAKVAVVTVVGIIGAYNHFGVIPKLVARRRVTLRHARPFRPLRKAGNMLRRSAGRETSLMAVIVLITAWLVVASVQE